MNKCRAMIFGSIVAILVLVISSSVPAIDSKGAASTDKFDKRPKSGEKLEQRERVRADEKALHERFETEKQALHKRFEEERKALQERFRAEEKTLHERFAAEKQKLQSRFEEERRALQARSK